MAVLLLLVIYIAFIGLGLPDSLFGTAWPAIYQDMGLPFSFGSFVTLITSCGTVLYCTVIVAMLHCYIATSLQNKQGTCLTTNPL